MSSSDNTAGRQPVDDESINPFVAFRHFADEQVSGLLQSVIGLPSAFHSSSSRPRSSSSDDVWLQEAREMRRHLARESEEAAQIVSIFRQAFGEGHHRVHDAIQPLSCPYRPVDQDMHHRSKEPPLDPVSPPFIPFLFSGLSRSVFGRGEVNAPHLWPVVYAASSPYSPLWLEHQEPFRTQGNKWRYAFEDLLALHSGKSMQEKDARREYENGASWMTSMLERGFFGNRWSVIDGENQASKQPLAASKMTVTSLPHDVEENEVTELDQYERFLGAQYPSPLPSSAPESGDQGLISTLTTTERNRLPDGSIHTKVVLRKRFSDGREESTETLHTAYDSQQPIPKDTPSGTGTIKEAIPRGESNSEAKESKRNGWFWS
ncbi:hypothetical protein MMC07_009700 [Pseudocyphellaria aurata]|nr:hypothetical protein [Pseudocyphellaria aurata]